MNKQTTGAQKTGMTLNDIQYMLYRQKWKIILCSAAGLLGAITLSIVQPSPYQSEAKLLIRYVLDEKSLANAGTDAKVKSPDARGEAIMNSEMEMLTSFDLAQQVVDKIGSEKILARAGGRKQKRTVAAALINPGNLSVGLGITGGDARTVAAGLVKRNLTVEVPRRSTVVRIVFRHPDPELAQSVLGQLVDDYLENHLQIQKTVEALDNEANALRSLIAVTDQELAARKTKAGVVSLTDTKEAYAREASRIRQELFDAEVGLAERQATLKILNDAPFDQIDEYHRIRTQLDTLYKREQTLQVEFTEENSLVKGVRAQIVEAEKLKTNLEEQNPTLASLYVRAGKQGVQLTAAASDIMSEETRISALESRIKVLSAQLDVLRAEASNLDRLEVELTDLQRTRELQENKYRSVSARLEQNRIDESLGDGKISSISKIQAPSPPDRNSSKSVKTSAMLIMGGVGLGLAWAFLTEFYLDSSVRRPSEIESRLQMPMLLSIPYLNGKKPHWQATRSGNKPLSLHDEGGRGAVPLWDGKHSLHQYYEALRDRLAAYFEGRNLAHKPKLVAVTSSDRGSGVTTVAAGLALCLAETGDGNVLLVDMSLGQSATQQFRKGEPKYSLNEALESETRMCALVRDKLYVVDERSKGDRLSSISPKRFSVLVTRLKASDYDYIIFDLPPVSQTSVTPRLAGLMDMVILVIESERTDREVVREARALLAESKTDVCAVLNKTRTYVSSLGPLGISQ